MPDHVEAVRDAIHAQLRSLEAEARTLRKMLAVLDAPEAGRKQSSTRPGRKQSIVRPAIEAVLRERPAGVWVHASEIMQEVRSRGVPLSEKDPLATIVTALIRMRNEGLVTGLGGNRWAWVHRGDPHEDGDE